MRAMMLTGIRRMEMREVPDPPLKADTDVLLKLAVVGVCGSDIHYYKEGRIGSQVVKYPFAVGHECGAVVEETGSAVTRLKPGDRVAVDPAISCGKCDQCLAGRPHTCRKLRFLGCPGQSEGCLSEYIVMPEKCCYAISNKMTMEQAALSEPLAISFYAVRQSLDAPLSSVVRSAALRGTKVGILGCGPIGLGVLISARASGCGTVYATDKIGERLAAASKAGAVWTGNPDQTDVVGEITRREAMLLDVVFDCCGQQEALDQAVQLLKPGGKLMIVGIPEVERVSFVIDLLRRKELSIRNVRRQRQCVSAVLKMMGSGELNGDFMITHRFPFDRAEEAFDLAANYGDGVIKAMIEFA